MGGPGSGPSARLGTTRELPAFIQVAYWGPGRRDAAPRSERVMPRSCCAYDRLTCSFSRERTGENNLAPPAVGVAGKWKGRSVLSHCALSCPEQGAQGDATIVTCFDRPPGRQTEGGRLSTRKKKLSSRRETRKQVGPPGPFLTLAALRELWSAGERYIYTCPQQTVDSVDPRRATFVGTAC